MIVKDFPNYRVCPLGPICNSKGKLLAVHWRGTKGGEYPYITLWQKGVRKKFSCHILVATHFIPNPENKPEVNHKNKDRSCWAVFNLEWASRSENMFHCWNYKK